MQQSYDQRLTEQGQLLADTRRQMEQMMAFMQMQGPRLSGEATGGQDTGGQDTRGQDTRDEDTGG